MSGADLSNWRTPPHLAGAFLHVDAILPVARIAAGGKARALASAPADLSGFKIRLRGRDYGLREMLEATASDGIVVLSQGRIIFEDYDNGMGAGDRHIIMSATKSATGLLAGVMEARGLIDLGAPVSAFLPELAHGPYRDASLRQLLDMRSGVRLTEELARAYAAAAGWDPPAAGEAPGSLHAFFRSLAGPPDLPHGGPFAYVSANTDLIGWVLERAGGASYADLFSEYIWTPMGAETDALITLDPAGAPRSTGGLCMTVRDFARMGQLLVDDGCYGGREIIPRPWIADTLSEGDRGAWAQGEFAQMFAGVEMAYRNSCYVVTSGPEVLFAMGLHGQALFIDRANELVLAKVSSQSQPVDSRAWALTYRALGEFRRIVGTGP